MWRCAPLTVIASIEQPELIERTLAHRRGQGGEETLTVALGARAPPQAPLFCFVSSTGSANLLVISGRRVDAPGAVSEAAESELAPTEIAALIEKNRDVWIGDAHVLHQTALDSLQAIEAHDTDALLEVGGSIDAACEACHVQFWYPEATP